MDSPNNRALRDTKTAAYEAIYCLAKLDRAADKSGHQMVQAIADRAIEQLREVLQLEE